MVILKSTFALLFYSEGYILLNENNSYFEIQKRVTGAIKKKREKPGANQNAANVLKAFRWHSRSPKQCCRAV